MTSKKLLGPGKWPRPAQLSSTFANGLMNASTETPKWKNDFYENGEKKIIDADARVK
jgi:hypothetical protein